jgi:hypothetical protein
MRYWIGRNSFRVAKSEAAKLSTPTVDPDVLERELLKRLEDWRGLLSRHVPQARQILRKLLPEPLRFTPSGDRVDGYFSFEGAAALGRLLSGRGGHPNLMASLMPASWNQIAGWLKQIDTLRRAA